jgi:urea carboxylase
MCIYPMDSPGGYQLVGRTLPIWNTWGQHVPSVFSPERPWMLEMFDVIKFYKVEEEELERLRGAFQDGSYVPTIEPSCFDAGQYDTFLASIEEEVAAYQAQQRAASQVQNALEAESLARLHLAAGDAAAAAPASSSDGEDHDRVDLAKLSSSCELVGAPVSSKVWSIKVKEGDVVSKNEVIVVLEAMKMEFNVKSGQVADSYSVQKLLVKPGQMVHLGAPIAILERIVAPTACQE